MAALLRGGGVGKNARSLEYVLYFCRVRSTMLTVGVHSTGVRVSFRAKWGLSFIFHVTRGSMLDRETASDPSRSFEYLGVWGRTSLSKLALHQRDLQLHRIQHCQWLFTPVSRIFLACYQLILCKCLRKTVGTLLALCSMLICSYASTYFVGRFKVTLPREETKEELPPAFSS